MGQRNVIIKAALVLAIVWGCVWGVRAYAGSKKITAERLNREIVSAHFADWSDEKSASNPTEARRRETKLRNIASLVNQIGRAHV